jgi:hypothetical protein
MLPNNLSTPANDAVLQLNKELDAAIDAAAKLRDLVGHAITLLDLSSVLAGPQNSQNIDLVAHFLKRAAHDFDVWDEIPF